jgi:uncharacterized repeat protein (TIGR01451 family)/MYXO-CTERM domain-containing protein
VSFTHRIGRRICTLLTIAALVGIAAPARAQVQCSLDVDSSPIGPGSVTTLTYSITNHSLSPVTGLAFSTTLPSGLILAAPANAWVSCTDGVLVAVDGASTVDLVDGRLGTNSSCSIQVDVTSGTLGVHAVASVPLTSSDGTSTTGSVDVEVDYGLPGFTLSASPNPAQFNSTTTLTFTIDNSLNTNGVFGHSFSLQLPAGYTVASPAHPQTDCGVDPFTAVTAVPGADVVGLTDSVVGPGAMCTVSVDVVAGAVGVSNLITSDLRDMMMVPLGRASVALEVPTPTVVHLGAFFRGDPVTPGGTVTLEYTVANYSRDYPATDISFSDDLSAVIPGLAAVGLPLVDVCGVGSGLVSNAGVLELTGGALAAEASCTFQVTLQVFPAAALGTYVNVTSAVTATMDGHSVVGNQGVDELEVASAPLISIEFIDDPVGTGSDVVMRVTLQNSSATDPMTDIGFTAPVSPWIPGATPTLPPAGFCGAGSTLVFGSLGFDVLGITMSGGDLAASGTCTFDVVYSVPEGISSGVYTKVTGAVIGTVAGIINAGTGASDDLQVVAPPRLVMEVLGNPVAPGGIATLQFTFEYGPEVQVGADDLTFTLDLGAAMFGLEAAGLPQNDDCGVGSTTSGTSAIIFSGGSLAPASSCSFTVDLQVPVAVLPGSSTLTTGSVVATVGGVAAAGSAASTDLLVSGFELTQEFTDDPVLPGEMVTLRFTLSNDSPATISNITFSEDLSQGLAGVPPPPVLPLTPCGPGSSLVQMGGSAVGLIGATLASGTICSFEIFFEVPNGVVPGQYPFVSSAVYGESGGQPIFAPAASSALVVADTLSVVKQFVGDPVGAGDTVELEFMVYNHANQSASQLTFVDDLRPVLDGLVAVGLPATGICGVGSQIDGTELLSFTGGNLGPDDFCAFSVTLQVPTSIPFDELFLNETSPLNGEIGATAYLGPPAFDELFLYSLDFAKSFDGPIQIGATTTLTFTLTNQDTLGDAYELRFFDDLSAVLPGLQAVGLPLTDVCGTGSVVSGTDLIQFDGGRLGPSESCTFDVTLQVPSNATEGIYDNITSEVTSYSTVCATRAAASLTLIPAVEPTFAKSFDPATIFQGGTSTLRLTIDNAGSGATVSAIDFTDNLPAQMVVADPPNAVTTCAGGAITAVAGAGVVSYTGGSLAGLESCTVEVVVTSSAVGTHVNTTGDLTSSHGVSGTAQASLVVQEGTLGDGGVDAGDDGGGNKGGCGCAASGSAGGGLAGILLLWFLVLALRRRRRRLSVRGWSGPLQ